MTMMCCLFTAGVTFLHRLRLDKAKTFHILLYHDVAGPRSTQLYCVGLEGDTVVKTTLNMKKPLIVKPIYSKCEYCTEC